MPEPGQILILSTSGSAEELEYLSADVAAEDAWLARKQLAKVRLEVVLQRLADEGGS